MQIKVFNVPIGASESFVEELNHFLRANNIVEVRKDLAMVDGNSCWTFCITYQPKGQTGEPFSRSGNSRDKVDYKEVLKPDVFERFAAMRKIRKQLAERDAVPAFAVFTDAELAELAKPEVLTLQTLQTVQGIGKKKLEKYGRAFIPADNTDTNETSGTSDRADSDAGQSLFGFPESTAGQADEA